MRRLAETDRRRVLKPIDSAWTVVVVEPVVTRVLPILWHRHWITPTGLTVLSVVLGAGSAAAFAVGVPLVAALLFEIRFILDCLDGNLARLRGTTSRFGALLDSLSDLVVVLGCFLALAVWADAPWIAVVLAASYPLSFSMKSTRDDLYTELGWHRPVETLGSRGPGGWLARHRIYPIVTSVDVEHLVLFVAPLAYAAGLDVLRLSLSLGAAYFTLQAIRFLLSILRAGRSLDHRNAHPVVDDTS